MLNETVQANSRKTCVAALTKKVGPERGSTPSAVLTSHWSVREKTAPPGSPVVPLSEAVPDLTKNRRARLQAGLLMTVRVCVNRPIGRPQAPRPSLVSPARPVNETSSSMSGLSPRVCSRDGGSVQLVDPGDLEIFQVGEASTSSDCCWSGSLE